jgi:hypothetical protein
MQQCARLEKTMMISAKFVWTRTSLDRGMALKAAANGADVMIAAVGLNADVESEQSNLKIMGSAKGDRDGKFQPITPRSECHNRGWNPGSDGRYLSHYRRRRAARRRTPDHRRRFLYHALRAHPKIKPLQTTC